MPFRKFRPLRQWGRYNTKIFKNILIARNKRVVEPYSDPDFIKDMGATVYNPLEPDFFKQFEESATPPKYSSPENFFNSLMRCIHCLKDGIAQACVLINATEPSSLPKEIYKHIQTNFLTDEQVIDCIMAGECYDPSLERLPKKFDPILFWITQKNLFGTPVFKRNNIILQNLTMKVALLYAHNESKLFQESRYDYDEPISSFLPINQSGVDAPLVFRHQPHLILQSESIISPIASRESIHQTTDKQKPNIYPISPLIDLEKTNIYNDLTIVPRKINPRLNIHTILWSREQDQKYPWTIEENAANSICHCFGAALAQALRNLTQLEFDGDSDDKILTKPILAKAIQLVNGKMDFVIVQLNTLNLANSKGVKNMIWLDKACPFYKPKPMHENMTKVEELNMETLQKFIGLLHYT